MKNRLYRLSIPQKAIIDTEEYFPEDTFNNCGGVLVLKKPVLIQKVEQSFNNIVKKCDVLRMKITIKDGEYYQYVEEYTPIKIEVVNYKNRFREFNEWLHNQENQKLFYYDKFLYNVKIVILPTGELGILFIFHHVIQDGYSIVNNMCTKIINEIYDLSEDNDSIYEYTKYIEAEEKYLISNKLEKDMDYWRSEIQSYEGEEFYKRGYLEELTCINKVFNLGEQLTDQINLFCKFYKVSIYNLFMGALIYYKSTITNNRSVCIGTSTLNRKNSYERKTAGLFTNTLPLFLNIENQWSVIDFINEIKKKTVNLFRHQKYGYKNIRDEYNQITGKAQNFIEITLTYLNAKVDNKIENSLYSINMSRNDRYPQPFLMTVMDFEGTGSIEIEYKFQIDKIGKEESNLIHLRLINLIKNFITKPNEKITNIPILDIEEKRYILEKFNDIKVSYPENLCIHQIFEEQVKRTPFNIAVKFDDLEITYEELNNKANQLARCLRNKNVGRNDFVGIVCDRSIEMIIAIYAVIKAGGAYVPINPDYPIERIEYMLKDCEAKIVLIGHKGLELKSNIEKIDLFDSKNYVGETNNLVCINKPEDLIYLIYTSGTTGKPKGVMLEHKNVVRLFKNSNFPFDFNDKDVWTMFHSYCFDFSVWEMYGATLFGGKLIVLSKDEAQDSFKLLKILENEKVTVLNQVPSSFYNLMAIDKGNNKLSIRYLIFGGEALNPKRLEKWYDLHPNINIVNMYGITETTVHVTYRKIEKEEIKKGISDIGKAIPTLKIYILRDNQLCGIGMPGELCVAGAGLARGYFKRDDLTKQKFVENPIVKGERIYHSGDLARWLPDGNIEYLGRIDEQVKVRGFRIELGEIDNVIRKQEKIKDVAVIVKSDESKDKQICAYIVGDEKIDKNILKENLREELPDYMIPTFITQIDKIPTNTNGKLDKKALEKIKIVNESEYVAPNNELEKKLVSIYEDILEITPIGIKDNFFEIGGHSLKATQLILKIYEEFQVEAKLSDFFKNPTIQELSQYIKDQNKLEIKEIVAVDEKDFYPVSSTQKRQLILSSMDNIGTSYNMPRVFRIKGRLHEEKIKSVFNELVDRHEAFRTSFHNIEGKFVQKIKKHVQLKIDSMDMLNMSEKEIFKTIKKFIKPFDLSKAPILRVIIGRLSDEDNILFIDMDHIISDGVSVNILIRDFISLYKGEKLPKLKIQYKDYSVWQQWFIKSSYIKKQEEYWINEFKNGIPVLNLPLDYPRPAVQSFEGSEIEINIDKAIKNKIHSIANRYNVSQYMVFLSAFYIVLWKYCRQDEIVIGCPIAGRNHIGVENIVGMFLNTLCIKNTIKGTDSIENFIKKTSYICLQAYENQDYPFEELVNKLHIVRDISRNPIFDVLFLLQNQGEDKIVTSDNTFTSINIGTTDSKMDLSLVGYERDSELYFKFQYSTKLFKQKTIERIAQSFIVVLETITKNLHIKLKDINVLPRKDELFILDKYNDTEEVYEEKLLLQTLFERQVVRTPNHIALIFEDKKLTYKELNEKANQTAFYLRKIGINKGDFIGVIGTRCFETIINILGVLKIGAAYVPISDDIPIHRRKDIINQSGCKLTLESNFYKTYDIEKYPKENIKLVANDDDLAYVIYTSGSTGKPKGVAISHKAVVNTIQDINTKFHVNETDCVLSISSLCFDLSVYDIFGTLSAGACLVLIHDQRDVLEMIECITKFKVTICNCVPAIMNMIVDSLEEDTIIDNLRLVMLSGDWIPLELPKLIEKHFPNADRVSLGGATEASIWSIYYKIKKISNEWKSIPYGYPLGNQKYYVLDKNEQLSPIGVPGELYIGGIGLAKGYLNDEEKTRAAFIEIKRLGRLYKTGDYGVLHSEGYIEFLGRQDNQVKIRGYRIELGEIEAILNRHSNVQKSCVVNLKYENNKQYLCAYIVYKKEDLHENLEDYLSQYLPHYMIPQIYISIDSFPLTSNGKINRKALPMPNYKEMINKKFVMPTNEVEKYILYTCSKMLKNDHISTTENLFNLGMDSVAITMLVVDLYKKFSIQVPLQNIFKTPTIVAISKYIQSNQNENKSNQFENIVLLRKGNEKNKNIFLLHALSGEVEPYLGLCNYIDDKFNCWGIKAEKRLAKSDDVPTIEEIATIYAKEICNIQEEGDYYIAGWSIGGTIAFEVTSILEKEGKNVVFLGMIDSPTPKNKKDSLIINFIEDYKIKDLIKKEQIEHLLAYVKEIINVDVNKIYGKINTLSSSQIIEKTNNIINLINIKNQYTPSSVINAPITFFKADNSIIEESKNWDKFSLKSIKIREIQGEHYELFDPKVLKKWGNLFNKLLIEDY